MKKIYLFYITLVSALIIGAISCEVDELNGKQLPENVRIFHLNPRTGAEYTDEELANLGYNPFEKEAYLIDQPIQIVVIGSAAPEKMEVHRGGALLTTITDFTQTASGEYESEMFTTTVTELGLAKGENAGLSFNGFYDNVGGGTAIVRLLFSAKYEGDISSKNSGFQLVGLDPANTRFLGLDTNDGRELQSFESNRMGYSYNGTDQYATVADDGFLDFRYENDFSIGFWVRTTSDDSDPEMIADQDWSSSGNKGITIAFRGDEWRAVASDGDNKADERTDGDVDPHFNDGQWHYLAVTYDRDGDMTLYQDGIEMISETMIGVGSLESGNPLRIAQDGTSQYGQFFEGDIADAKIFDYVLSEEDIADLAGVTPSGVLVSYESGFSRELKVSLEGGPELTTFSNGMLGYEFDGINQYATIDDESQLDFRHEGDFTISFWVNTTSDDSDPEMIGDQDWSSSGNAGITIAFRGEEYRAVASDGENKADIRTNDEVDPHFNDGEWHLLAVTYDRDGLMTMYQDGIEMYSESMAAVGNIESGNPLRIAQDGTGNYPQYFQGKIAGTVIHNYALSADEILDLYNN